MSFDHRIDTRSPYAQKLDDLSLDAWDDDRERFDSEQRDARMYDRDICAVLEQHTRALDEASVPSPVSEADSATRKLPSSTVATAADPKSHRALADHANEGEAV